MTRNIFITALAAMAAIQLTAKVRLPHIISNGMVIKQNSNVPLWGWAEPGRKVSATMSWTDKRIDTTADKDGRWTLTVHTPQAGFDPLTITFDDGDRTTTVKDVLAGEVWVCAGQSNMEMPVRGFGACPVEGYNATIADANNHPGIRFAKIPSVMSMTPLDDTDCRWVEADINGAADCSAVGYYFARTVTDALHIPIGLIMANKGGTRLESWLNRDNLSQHTDEPLDSLEMVRKYYWDFHRPLLWGNGTFSPILNCTVSGILFYQGCSNVGDPGDRYSERMKMLVEQWRHSFGQGELPFLFVQIAPYWNGNADADAGVKLREQQLKAARIIPNSGIVCTQDLVYPYEERQIHPCRKREVGERLAYMALNRYYGCSGLMCESPSFESMRISGDTCFVKLNNLYDGLNRWQDITGFELAGEDKVFHPAKAEYEWHQGVMVTSSEVPHPVAVRYCYHNFTQGNAANHAGLPLFPFRSDNW